MLALLPARFQPRNIAEAFPNAARAFPAFKPGKRARNALRLLENVRTILAKFKRQSVVCFAIVPAETRAQTALAAFPASPRIST